MRTYREQGEAAYGGVARFLHWAVVVLIAAQFLIGWTMPDVHRDTQPVGLIAWHLAVGAALIVAIVVRVVWRLTHRPPPDTLSPIFSAASRLTHFLLYTTLLAVPLLGWANASSRGWEIKLFGMVSLPALAPAGSAVGHAMGDVHGVLAWVLFSLIAVHVAAALFHHLILKDRVVQRMI